MTNESTNGTGGEPMEEARATAYALGELSHEERARFEREMRLDPALVREVASISALAQELRASLGSAEECTLDPRRRSAILQAARPGLRSFRRARNGILAIAAGLMILAGGIWWAKTSPLFATHDEESMPSMLQATGPSDDPVAQATGSVLQGLGYYSDNDSSLVAGADRPRETATPTPPADFRSDSESSITYSTGGLNPSSTSIIRNPDLELVPSGGFVPESIARSLGYIDSEEVPADQQSVVLFDTESGSSPIAVGPRGAPAPGSWSLGRGSRESAKDEISLAPGTEAYDEIREPGFRDPLQDPLSTFSIDVDTASYANVRRFLAERRLPPPDAVRIEELVNYFSYDYPEPAGGRPFSVALEVAGCPWEPSHRVVRIGLKGRSIDYGERKTRNLVFLVDVSGSMDEPMKLPLVQKSLRLLVNELSGDDRVAIVTYAGTSGLTLASTSIEDRARILGAIDGLRPGGSTNGGEGIQLAYRTALEHFAENGVNRVVLATDGDFNVGITDRGALLALIEAKAKSGVFLSVLGFGTGNLKDATMEQLADHGNGNYGYVDSLAEARKLLVRELGATLETIAKDVKIQVEFNPATVGAWRLIGYENRKLAAQDFNDDRKDAGEIGAGHTVTALYEIVPAGVRSANVDALKYQGLAQRVETPKDQGDGELLTVKLRYKEPTAETSQLLEAPLVDSGPTFERASEDLRFAAAVALFGMCLRSSDQRGGATLEDARHWAESALGEDPHGDRREFTRLVDLAAGLASGR